MKISDSITSLMSNHPELTSKQIFQKALELVEQHLDLVRMVSGKKIVLFVGRSQNGKSTTINCCCGIRFYWKKLPLKPGQKYGSFELTPVPPAVPLAPMGTGGLAGTTCPAVYWPPQLPKWAFVDSRGVDEVCGSSNADGVLASGILTEMMCKVAKKVRIVVIARFSSLNPLSGLNSVLIHIGSLLKDARDPILWVFNDNPLISKPLMEDSFEQAIESIEILVDKHYAEFQNRGLIAGAQPPAPQATKSQSVPLAEQQAVTSLKLAIDANPQRISYFDPTSQWSVDKLLGQIKDLDPIPISNLKLDTSTPYRSTFVDGLASLLLRESNLLRAYLDLAVYDANSIEVMDPMAAVCELDTDPFSEQKRRNNRLAQICIERQQEQAKITEFEACWYPPTRMAFLKKSVRTYG
jgi:hypothetical protein